MDSCSSNRDTAACFCPAHPNGQGGRNLVVCIDGTKNQFGKKNTNVVELYRKISKDDHQLTYYSSGIGTFVQEGSKVQQSLDIRPVIHLFDLMFAFTFQKNVMQAYRWLSEMYAEGDKIFLFGFSRGAYQVRVIAGMIEKVGLLYRGNLQQISFAYGTYMRCMNLGDSHKEAQQFKETFSRPSVRVHFIGAWDTVSSVGFVRGRSLPETTTGMKHVCAFRHALALDELRVKFLPEYANGGGEPERAPQVKEVWFAGSHSDIGGGNADNLESSAYRPSLRWMSYEAKANGLSINPNTHPGFKLLSPTSSMNWGYRILEYIPITHLTYKDESSVVRKPHLRRPRQMKENQRIHSSVFREMSVQPLRGEARKYRPKALTARGEPWNESFLRHSQALIEPDPYLDLALVLSKLEKDGSAKHLTDHDIATLSDLMKEKIGRFHIVHFHDAANIIINALRTQLQFSGQPSRHDIVHFPEQKEYRQSRLVGVMVEALKCFEEPPHYAMKDSEAMHKALWSELTRFYPDTLEECKRFMVIFHPRAFEIVGKKNQVAKKEKEIEKLQKKLGGVGTQRELARD